MIPCTFVGSATVVALPMHQLKLYPRLLCTPCVYVIILHIITYVHTYSAWSTSHVNCCIFLPTHAGSNSSSDRRAFADEINLMVKVSTCNNPHIIKLIGCITKQSPTAILLELALYGNLCDYLRSCRHAGTDKEVYATSQED